ncbi:MAG: OmpA family protein [Chitinophagaceae bacterium]
MKRFLLLVFFSISLCSALAQTKSYVVYFDRDEYAIPDSALVQIVRFMHSYSIDNVLLEGHCDSIASIAYNKHLSIQRAQAVKRLMTQNGLPEKNIKTCIGNGKEKPLNQNKDEFEMQLNRRVVITYFLSEKQSIQKALEPIPNADTIQLVKAIENKKKGDKVRIDNLLFWGGTHLVKPESYEQLNQLRNILIDRPSLKIEIQGHVCCTSTEPDGHDVETGLDNLSEARAEAIYYYLIKQGISSKRLQHRGFGGTQKINEDESNEELRSINRRVEIMILEQ